MNRFEQFLTNSIPKHEIREQKKKQHISTALSPQELGNDRNFVDFGNYKSNLQNSGRPLNYRFEPQPLTKLSSFSTKKPDAHYNKSNVIAQSPSIVDSPGINPQNSQNQRNLEHRAGMNIPQNSKHSVLDHNSSETSQGYHSNFDRYGLANRGENPLSFKYPK